MGNEDERQLLPTRIGLKARHVIARPEGPGMVPRNFPKPCKGVPDVFQFVGEMGAAAGPPLQGLGELGGVRYPALLAGLSHCGLTARRQWDFGPPISRAKARQSHGLRKCKMRWGASLRARRGLAGHAAAGRGLPALPEWDG